MSNKVLVLDASAFIMGYDPLSIREKQVTTPSIGNELRSKNTIWLRFKMACDSGKLEVLSPSPHALKIVEELAKKTGDFGRLSKADREVLAVAEELRREGCSPIIVSDDYSIQNVADQLKLEYISLSTFGIRQRFQWIPYCPGCHKRYPTTSTLERCRICGTPLKRRPRKKALTRKNSK
jgi:rRNA maturation endonuclease Nob1